MDKYPQNPLRKLARSSYYQNLYARAKDLGTIRLFDNDSHLSKVQVYFLFWLETYHRLQCALAMNEKYISQETIDNDLRCDCYMIWEHKEKNKELDKSKETKRSIDSKSKIPSVVFRKARK